MDEMSNILGKPRKVKGLGDVYPVTLDDYMEFMGIAKMVTLTEKHMEQMKVNISDDQSLFEMVIGVCAMTGVIESFIGMVDMVTRKSFRLDDEHEILLLADDGSYLSEDNFMPFREIVMDQNLLYEEKVFKNPMVKKWADKVIEARQKDAVDMSMEDIISVVHVGTGVPFDKIGNYTIYQLKHTFERIVKLKEWDRSIQLLCAGAEGVKPEPYMEKIELAKNPYDDVFKKNSDNKLDKAIGK